MEAATTNPPAELDPYDAHLADALTREYGELGMTTSLAIKLLHDRAIEPWKPAYLAARAANQRQPAA